MKQTLIIIGLAVLTSTALQAQHFGYQSHPKIGYVQAREFMEESMQENTIPARAFKDAAILKEIILPDNITEIGEEAFSGCSNLKSIILYTLDLAKVGANAIPDQEGLIVTVQNEKAKALIEGGKAFKHTKFVILHPTGMTPIEDFKYILSTASDKSLRIENLDTSDCIILIYNMAGELVRNDFLEGSSIYSTYLESGSYIVLINNKTFKIVID